MAGIVATEELALFRESKDIDCRASVVASPLLLSSRALCWPLVMLKRVLTRCGNESLLSLFGLQSAFHLRVAQPRMAAGSWQGWQSWRARTALGRRQMGFKVSLEDFTRVRRSDGTLDVKPVCQESTWKEHEEQMTELVLKLEGKLFCALSRKLTTDNLSECGERSGPSRVFCDGRLGARWFDRLFPDKAGRALPGQGNWKQAWTHYVKRNRQKSVCHHGHAC